MTHFTKPVHVQKLPVRHNQKEDDSLELKLQDKYVEGWNDFYKIFYDECYVTNKLYVEMQNNHIAYEKELLKKIEELSK